MSSEKELLKRDLYRIKDKETVLGLGTSLKGELSFKSALTVKGMFEGKIASTGHLVINEQAVVKADVTASSIDLKGQLYGHIDVKGLLELEPSATMIGDAKVRSLKIEKGAAFKGRISMLKNIDEIDIFSASTEQLKKVIVEKYLHV